VNNNHHLQEIFISRKELAKRWSLSKGTIKRMDDAGRLNAITFNSRVIRYRISEILDIEDSGSLSETR
jgi:DNA-binding Xre family transcriptional regulator